MASDTVQLLSDHGIRVSLQRIAVMSFLMDNQIHPTVETIYNGLHTMFPTLSRSTIYQALELFCEKGVAQKIVTGDGEMRFDAEVFRHGISGASSATRSRTSASQRTRPSPRRVTSSAS